MLHGSFSSSSKSDKLLAQVDNPNAGQDPKTRRMLGLKHAALAVATTVRTSANFKERCRQEEEMKRDMLNAPMLDPKLSPTGKLPGAQEAPAIDPELAAQVVREYLLPMFDGKKSLLKSDKTKAKDADSTVDVDTDIANGLMKRLQENGSPTDGIYGEMKLSDKLLDQLQSIKGECRDLRTRLASSERD